MGEHNHGRILTLPQGNGGFDRMISLRPVGYGVTSRMDEEMDRVDRVDRVDEE